MAGRGVWHAICERKVKKEDMNKVNNYEQTI